MNAVIALKNYALRTGLIEASEERWAVNTILDALRCDALPEIVVADDAPLHAILAALTDDAYARGVLAEDSVVYRDLFDTGLMGRLTPRPAQVIAQFEALRAEDPRAATDWYFWDEAHEVMNNREYCTYTGVYKGVPISCMSTGMGCPSVAIGMVLQ